MKNLIQPSGSWSGSRAQLGSGSRCAFGLSAISLAAVLAIGLPFGTLAGTIIVPSGSIVTIQDGVDAASPGDTIHVLPGNYDEDVSVATPRIKLQAETGSSPVIVASFLIQADEVEIEGFQVQNLRLVAGRGIQVTRAAGVHVLSNTIIRGSTGILVSSSSDVHVSSNTIIRGRGILVSSSSDVHIDHNTVSSGGFGGIDPGIVVENSSETHVDYNVASSDETEGILVSDSSGTHVDYNTAHGGGLFGVGIFVFSSSNGKIDHNTVSGSIVGILVSDDSCGNRFDDNSAQGGFLDLDSAEDPAAPCNRYNNNEADTAFPSLEFWDVK